MLDNKTTKRIDSAELLEELYQARYIEKSDINECLPILRTYANIVDHVTEFGVREGNSTVALACGRPQKMISYDINSMDQELEKLLKKNINFHFIKSNVLKTEIEKTDLLFIDTFHTYQQLKRELELHSGKVRKYLIFHDVVTFGEIGEDGSLGIMKAIVEFLEDPDWEDHELFLPAHPTSVNNILSSLGKDRIIKKGTWHNNGLLVCQKN